MTTTKNTTAAAIVTRALVTGLLFFAVAAQVILWGQAPAEYVTGGDTEQTQADTNAPDFSWVADTDLAAGCVSTDTWSTQVADLAADDLARIPAESIQVLLDGTVERVSTDTAWAAAEAAPDAAHWIIASCN